MLGDRSGSSVQDTVDDTTATSTKEMDLSGSKSSDSHLSQMKKRDSVSLGNPNEPKTFKEQFFSYFDVLNDTRFVAGLLVLTGTMFGSMWSVDMEYLEDEGITFSQMFLISEIEILIYASIIHLMILFYHYLQNDEYYQVNSDVSNSNSSSDNKLRSYILWIFPPFSEEYWPLWRVMLGRGIFLSCAFQFKIIALIYVNAGDVMVIRSTTTSFGMVIVSILYFKEKLTWGIVISFLLSLIGVVLICQPAFLFGGDDSDTISAIGLMFTILAGLSRVCEKSFVKLSNTGGMAIHWMAIILVPYLVTLFVAAIIFATVFVVEYVNYDGNASEAINEVWYRWYDRSIQDQIINLWLVLYGVFLMGRSLCNTIGYQTGDMSRLGIIANSDVLFAYIVQAIALDVVCNWLVYFGACIVVGGAFILFYEQARIAEQKKRELQNAINDENQGNSAMSDSVVQISSSGQNTGGNGPPQPNQSDEYTRVADGDEDEDGNKKYDPRDGHYRGRGSLW